MNKNARAKCTGLLVKLQKVSLAQARTKLRTILGADARVELLAPGLGWYKVVSAAVPPTPGAGFDLAAQVRRRPGIIDAEPALSGTPMILNEFDARDPRARAADEPPDPATEGKYFWHLGQVKAKDAWQRFGVQGKGMRIGHLDTGYTRHPELIIDAGVRADLGYNFEEKQADPTEPLSTIDHGHGTATASVLIGQSGRQHEIPQLEAYAEGIAPRAELVPLRVDTDVWFVSPVNDVKGITHALRPGVEVDVISMSRGGLDSEALHDAVRLAVSQGVIVVAAAGNYNPATGYRVVAPGQYPEVVCAAGSTFARTPWAKSSRGREVTIGAPARSVYRAQSQKKHNDYYYWVERSSGTSFATPLVAGAAVLWLERHGGRETVARAVGGAENIAVVFKHVLMTQGFQPGVEWDTNEFGTGILDVVALLDAPLSDPRAVPGVRDALLRRQRPYPLSAQVLGRMLRLEMMELDLYCLLDPDIGRIVAALSEADDISSNRRLRRQLREQLVAVKASTRLARLITEAP
jgi:subtilisin family serine protease